MFRILEEGFTPTVEDILRSRVRTTGIVELGFRLNFDKRELNFQVHRKKSFTSFPSPAGMSLTKFPLGRNNSVMTSLFPPRESLVVTSRLGTGNSRTFFLRCRDVEF
jgi:hypothetical protein